MIDLEIVGLYKAYGSQSVLRNLDLVAEAGSFTSILGPSGSGKTTLLRVIAGFERVDRGEVHLRGEVVDDGDRYVQPNQRRIGYVPQDGSLFPHLSVRQNVGFGLSRRERNGTKIVELLEMVDLGGMGDRYPHQLSGGQQQRVALARALAIDPSLVLLDEPFSSLDASLRSAVRQDVRRVLRESGTTVLLVTHDQDEALSLADEVAVIEDGSISQRDTPAGLYAYPVSPELARGLGEVNFLRGTARSGAVETPLGRLDLVARAIGNDAAPDGAELIVLVRPEQLALVARDAEGDATARVVETEFYGHDAVIRLRADWDESTIIVVRTTEAKDLPTKDSRVALRIRGGVVAWQSEVTQRSE